MSNTPPPPPPPDSSWNQPPPAPAAPPPPPNFGSPAPAYGAPSAPMASANEMSSKPPRPNVRVGALLMIIGAVVTGIAAALPWLKAGGDSLTGFDDFLTDSDGELKILQGPGKIWIFFAVVVAGLGIALYLAGRVLAVAIVGIVFAAIGAFFVLGSIGIASDTKDLAGEGSYGFGLFVGMIAMLAALGGAIAATAKRRR